MIARNLKKIILLSALIVSILSGSAFCQNPAQTDNNKENAAKLFKEYSSLQKKIQQLQEPVIQNNSELQSQIKEINAMITEKWEKNAEIFNVNIQKLSSLEEKIKNNEISSEEKQKLMGEYKDESHKFYKAKQATLTDEKVASFQRELSAKIKAETIKSNPDSSKVYSQLEKIEKKLTDIQKKMN